MFRLNFYFGILARGAVEKRWKTSLYLTVDYFAQISVYEKFIEFFIQELFSSKIQTSSTYPQLIFGGIISVTNFATVSRWDDIEVKAKQGVWRLQEVIWYLDRN